MCLFFCGSLQAKQQYTKKRATGQEIKRK